MKKTFGKLFLVTILFLVNCQFAGPGLGILYTDTKFNQFTNSDILSTKKKGEACSVSYLLLFSIGDASVKTAITKAEINKISIIDHQTQYFFPGGLLYYRFCTIVYGDWVDPQTAQPVPAKK